MTLAIALLMLAQAVPQVLTVTGEVPAWHPSLGYWTVSHAPLAIACYRGGSRQITGADFTVAGATLRSASWTPLVDKLVCDYSYAGPPLYAVAGAVSITSAAAVQWAIDTGYLSHRVAPPPAAGACVDPSGLALIGAWAADANWFYFCVPGAAGGPDYVWARVALSSTW